MHIHSLKLATILTVTFFARVSFADDGAAPPATQPGHNDETVTLKIATDRTSVRNGEQITLRVVLKNEGTTDAPITVGQNLLERFKIEVWHEGVSFPPPQDSRVEKNSDGSDRMSCGKTAFGLQQEMLGGTTRTIGKLPPGKEISCAIPLNRIYDMSLAGKYEISVTTFVFKRPNQPPTEIESNEVTVSIADDGWRNSP